MVHLKNIFFEWITDLKSANIKTLKPEISFFITDYYQYGLFSLHFSLKLKAP